MKLPRPKLSLGTFLLLLTVAILSFSHAVTSRQLAETRQELRDYRYQYGHLVVDDPSRPHVLRYAKQDNPWKWHVNLPKGKNYRLTCGVGQVPLDGLPNEAELQHVRNTWITGDGENKTLFVSLTESGPDRLKLSIGGDGAQTTSQVLPKADLYKRSVFNSFSAGHAEPFVADSDDPFVLFYQTERSPNANASAHGTENGVVVWMVPVSPDS